MTYTCKYEMKAMKKLSNLTVLHFLCKSEQCFNAVVKTFKMYACRMSEFSIFHELVPRSL